MSFCFKWKQIFCCCKKKKASEPHKYCGCGESSKQGVKVKMKTVENKTYVDDRRTLVEDDEAVDVLEYEFTPETVWSFEEPEIPFSYDFTDAVHPQFDIIIQGTVDLKALRFAVNLVSSLNGATDIVFHFNPRFDQRYSACNSRFEDKWGREEHSTHQKFPFQRGQRFFLEIFLTHSEFLVAVNGVQYCSFAYRSSLLNITGLMIEGAVTLSHVNFIYASFYPSTLPVDYPPSPYKYALPEGITKNETQRTPVYGFLQGKLRPGSEIEINGLVELLPHAFYFNLQEGCHIWPHPEIPFHMSVRFIQGEDEIRTNSWIGTNWGKEEPKKRCIFTPGYNFSMKITCTQNEFQVKVNDKPQLTFKHRVPYTNIDTLHIQGDVLIYDTRVHL